jgi:divalent metal cation (Fe/Co/Zn/Cd) transporter
VIVWRFTGARLHSEAAEQRAQKLVAAQFFILAPLVTFEALRQVIAGDEPSVSWLGIVLALTSLIWMPLLGVAKRRLADQLGSAATRGEGTQNLSAPISPPPFSSGCWATPYSGCGGSTRWPHW